MALGLSEPSSLRGSTSVPVWLNIKAMTGCALTEYKSMSKIVSIEIVHIVSGLRTIPSWSSQVVTSHLESWQ